MPNKSLANPNTNKHQNNSSQPIQLTDFPNEVLLTINNYLSSKDTAHLVSVSWQFYTLFQPEIGKKEVKDAAACAINPIKENIEKLKALLEECPALLLHKVTVKNRHGMVIKGTVYQIALHEGDDELIDDVIKPAFMRLHHGLETMEAQRKTWLPDGWMEAEERACASACDAIDNVFTAFKNAINPNDVTELPNYPYTITIHNQQANIALDAFRNAIDVLYKPTDKVIESGRDPIIRLLERVMNRYEENYNALGGYDTPHNNTLMRAVFGYCERSAPINFMQAFAQGIYYILENKEKLTRSFEYRHWVGNFILPLDSGLQFRLGYEYFARVGGGGAVRSASVEPGAAVRVYKTFCQSKTAAALQTCYATTGKVLRNNVA
ncbi:MAG TPA: hypothetical protein VJN02_10985 [Gammaproteobacteria bacterium]|nr:hypothetical protein [Gammaproteobacteria bacterium]